MLCTSKWLILTPTNRLNDYGRRCSPYKDCCVGVTQESSGVSEDKTNPGNNTWYIVMKYSGGMVNPGYEQWRPNARLHRLLVRSNLPQHLRP